MFASECYIDLLKYACEYLDNEAVPSTPRTSSDMNNTVYKEIDDLGRLTVAMTSLQKHETFFLCVQVHIASF